MLLNCSCDSGPQIISSMAARWPALVYIDTKSCPNYFYKSDNCNGYVEFFMEVDQQLLNIRYLSIVGHLNFRTINVVDGITLADSTWGVSWPFVGSLLST